MRPYQSFLIRCWMLGDDTASEQQVFDISHIQTGAQTRVETFSELQHCLIASYQTWRDQEQPDKARQTAADTSNDSAPDY